jgi:hypothetical protein
MAAAKSATRVSPRRIAVRHRQIEQTPQLLPYDGEDQQHLLCTKLELLSERKDRSPSVLLILGFLLAVEVSLGFIPSVDGISESLKNGIVLGALQITLAALTYFSRYRAVTTRLPLRLFLILLDLETNGSRWDLFHYRVTIIRKMERLAREVQRIPRSTGVTDAYVLGLLTERADECAASLRHLQVQAAMPEDDTRQRVITDLTSRFLLLVDGRWYDLPRAEIDHLVRAHARRRRQRGRIIISVVAATVVFAGALLSATQLDPSTAELITPFLLSSVITILGAAGIEFKALGDSINIAHNATSKQDATANHKDS